MFLSLLTIGAAASAFFGSASALGCDEADRYGVLTFLNPIVLGEFDPTFFAGFAGTF
ncbi:hypothetical protein BDP27DRAFT_1419443 [Rhodocollybia butyracea]|uniref:Uncharacterized protein n=1 Tax=Rhodocollybia butyracea TaxID=206335 RepID=A0A9P5PRJ8_9AGAR|nr:hypothetical protein BDP27DRAFT_1419443 [Rhodocollybia butyracea]